MDNNYIIATEARLWNQLAGLERIKREALDAELLYCDPNDYEAVRGLYEMVGITYTRANWHTWQDSFRTAYRLDNPGLAPDDRLSAAILLATKAHAGQSDKAGAPYIFHPLRVMLALTDPEEQIVAVLHDVIEDSRYTFADIAETIALSDEQIIALGYLTHNPALSYEEYIQKISRSEMARHIKLKDLTDNMNLDRLTPCHRSRPTTPRQICRGCQHLVVTAQHIR